MSLSGTAIVSSHNSVHCCHPHTFDVQWSLHFKTTHSARKMWSYIEGGLKIEGHLY